MFLSWREAAEGVRLALIRAYRADRRNNMSIESGGAWNAGMDRMIAKTRQEPIEAIIERYEKNAAKVAKKNPPEPTWFGLWGVGGSRQRSSDDSNGRDLLAEGLNLKVSWSAEESIELCCSAKIGERQLEACLIEDHECMKSLALALEGFPRSEVDERVAEFGCRDSENGEEGITIRLKCSDVPKTAILELRFRDCVRECGNDGDLDMALSVEVACIEDWLSKLRTMDTQEGAVVHLPAADLQGM